MKKKKQQLNWKIVTNCSSIKRWQGTPITPDTRAKTIEELSDSWIKNLSKSKNVKKASDTYGGRSFVEAKNASELIGADMFIISAGLGLISSENLIPHYSLTTALGKGSISNWLKSNQLKSTDWWSILNKKLNQKNSISQLVKESKGVILALPSTYLELIKEELNNLDKPDTSKIYIITSEFGRKLLKESLQERCLPYDERLDGSALYKGTRNDFPQRSLKHFVSETDFEVKKIDELKIDINRYLKKLKKPVIPKRKKIDDEKIIILIKKNWSKCNGRREGIHRHLRDKLLVACEQNRFGALWNKVRADLE
jgi:hypothetical protein